MESARLIRGARRAAGLSQARLAARAGTSQPTLAAYEAGTKVPSARTLERVLAAAGRRLSMRPGPVVLVPGRGELERAGQTLVEVIELASQLPTAHRSELDYPRLPSTRA